MVSEAREQDREDLIVLWREAFLEEPYAVCFYNAVSFDDIFVWRDGERAVSMLHFLPCSFGYGRKTYRGAYLYALATLRQYRKKGIMGKLIKAAKERAEKEKLDFLCLAAANRELCGYYEAFGFRAADCAKESVPLDFSARVKKYARWERMREDKTENTSEKEDILKNQMIYATGGMPFCKFLGDIPY
ncbi:MAG: GNAT family N-acetyltransferase [Alistipes sp.]|nr:GNAT family N-acetyltransferase [Alistipes sp.]